MGDRIAADLDHLPEDLQGIAQSIERAALVRRGNEIELLALLRLLELLHSQIRDGWFQEAMPTNRQRLYALLRDIEVNGGWPYIQRMRLQSLLKKLELEEQNPATEENPGTKDEPGA